MENTISNSAEIVLRFLSEFSFRKVMSLILLIAMAFGCIMIFDRITESLSLSRIDHSLTILERLDKLDVGKDPDLVDIRKKLIVQLDDAVTPKALLPSIKEGAVHSVLTSIKRELLDLGIWTRILVSMSLWLLVSLFGLIQFFRGKENQLGGVVACIIVGALFAWLGLLLPEISWLIYIVYPIGHFTLFLLFAVGVGIYKKKQRGDQKCSQ